MKCYKSTTLKELPAIVISFPMWMLGGLEDIKVPALIVAPRNSFASPVALNQEMARRIPDSRLIVIESVGHMVYVREPEHTCNAILQWVVDLHARRPSELSVH